jgi:biopolymer transport protein ExbB
MEPILAPEAGPAHRAGLRLVGSRRLGVRRARCGTAWCALCAALVFFAGRGVFAAGAQIDAQADSAAASAHDPRLHEAAEAHGDTRTSAGVLDGEHVLARVQALGREILAWYQRTPASDRVTWGGLTVCAGLGVLVVLERLLRLRGRSIIPTDFTARFLDRLHDGKLDCGQALDHCELNPGPAARVALAAIRRWGRPPSDLERAVALAQRVEADRLRRNVGTLRRIAALAPLLGLLGTLFALGRTLEAISVTPAASALIGPAVPSPSVEVTPPAAQLAWGPTIAATLTPLCASLIIATLALVAYDGLLARIEKLSSALDRLGAETIDAIAMSAPASAPLISFAPARPPAPLSQTDHLADSAHPRTPPAHLPPARADAPRAAHVAPVRNTGSRHAEGDLGF